MTVIERGRRALGERLHRARSASVLDAAILVVTGLVALLGLRSTFLGWWFLVSGGIGLLLGVAIALLAVRYRLSPVLVAAATSAAYFVAGGTVAREHPGVATPLPTPDTIAALARSAIHGWKALLTTLPPIDGGAPLLVPYLLGLAAGSTGMTAAARLRSPLAPVTVLVALQVAVIALGVREPGAVALGGAAVGFGAIGWVAVRRARLRSRSTRVIGGQRWRGRLAGAALAGCAATVGLLLGPAIAESAGERMVLRTHVEPPFDVGQYGSPLAAFRIYTSGYQTDDHARKLYDRELFRVTGLPDDARVRVATLDAYDGHVWTAADDSGLDEGRADTFQRVGAVIDNPAAGSGPTMSGTVTIGEAYSGVWVPSPGALTGIRFVRPDSETGRGSFRYNLATSTGLLPGGLGPGDSYTFDAVLPEDDLGKESEAWPGDVTHTEVAAQFAALAAAWAPGGKPPLEKVRMVAERLRLEGSYTDGEPPNQQYPAGHSLRRLADFAADGSEMAGNDEQYAALMALLADQLGVPSRVTLGAVPGRDGVVRGRDVHAWVELRVADGSWRTLDWPEFMSTERRPQQQAPQPAELVEGNVVPPPVPVRPPVTSGDPLDRPADQRGDAQEGPRRSGSGGWLRWLALVAGPPVALLLGALAVVGAKSWRRRRRRRRGPPTRRVALGWQEVVDRARDFGHRVTPTGTRWEQAAELAVHPGLSRAPGVALETELTMFAAEPPTAEAAASCWQAVDELTRELATSRRRRGRWWAALHPRTLLPWK